MIVGVGTDIVEIARIEAAFGRHGRRFVERILGPQERDKFDARFARQVSRGIAFLATRFAAKEALSKGLGLGIHMPMHWRAAQLLNAPSGKPMFRFDDRLQAWIDQRGWLIEASISDEHAYAVAFVVVSKNMSIHVTDGVR